MVVTGDLVTPRLNGVKYFEKPPLFYWLQAVSIKTFGIHFWSMRLWPMFFAIWGGIMVYVAGLTFFSRKTGLYAAGMLSTMLLYYVHSRLIVLDLAVSIFISATVLLAYGALHPFTKSKREPLLLGAYACAALACLTKGLIGIVLPGLIFAVWGIFIRDFYKILRLFSLKGILIFLVIAAPWHILVCLRNPDFAYFYFIGEHFLRYTTEAHRRFQPFLFFVPIIGFGILPWAGAISSSMKDLFNASKIQKTLSNKETTCHETTLFLAVWSGVVFLFFSFSHSKLIPYILPVFPALALLGGEALRKREESGKQHAFCCLGFIDIVFALGVAGYGMYELSEDAQLKTLFSVDLWSIALFSLAAVSLPLFVKGVRGQVFKGLAWMPVLIFLNTVAIQVQEEIRPSIKPLADIVLLNARPEDRILCLGTYYQDLPVYLNRLVDIAEWEGELAFGIHAEDVSHRMMSAGDFWPIFQGDQRVFVLTQKNTYTRYWRELYFSHKILAETERDIVFINK
jgi:4-amino-4-deoxy-L-arabinose transferase-like glycosyltransferase